MLLKCQPPCRSLWPALPKHVQVVTDMVSASYIRDYGFLFLGYFWVTLGKNDFKTKPLLEASKKLEWEYKCVLHLLFYVILTSASSEMYEAESTLDAVQYKMGSGSYEILILCFF